MGFAKPLVGFGANGWVSAYKGYQNYIYNSKETHSEPLKILVETGFPGLLFFLLLWLGFLKHWLNSWKTRQLNRNYLLGVAALGIGLHSLMDLDLSLSSIFFTFTLLLASLRANPNEAKYRRLSQIQTSESNTRITALTMNPTKKRLILRSWITPKRWTVSKSWIIPSIMAPLAFLLILASPLIITGQSYAEQGKQALNAGQYAKALNLDQLAVKYFPYQSSAFEDLALLKMSQGVQTSDQQLITQALTDMNRALTLNSSDPIPRSTATRVYSLANQPDLAYRQAQRNLELADLYPSGYESVAKYALLYAEQLILAGKVSEAQPLLRQVLNLSPLIEQRLARVSEKDKKRWYTKPHLTVTPRLELYRGEAFALLGDQENAIKTFTAVSTDETLKLEALLWKGSIEKYQGNPQGEFDLINAQALNPQIKASFQPLATLLQTIK